jgi:hypothetical protein
MSDPLFAFENGTTRQLSDAEAAAVRAEWATADLAAKSAAARKSELAAIRYAKEVGGIVVGGAPVATDRETQAKLIAARILAKENAGYTVNWKTPAGFVSLDAATIISVADAVAAHIQACFDREAVLSAAIDNAADAAARAAIDLTAGWPS